MFNKLFNTNNGAVSIMSPWVRPALNIGALQDIPTGEFIAGKYGEYILNGGLQQYEGITGIANSSKSLLLHFKIQSAMSRLYWGKFTKLLFAMTYDTESMVRHNRLNRLSKALSEFSGKDIVNKDNWMIMEAIHCPGDMWYDKFKDFCAQKIKLVEKEKLVFETPFYDEEEKTLFKWAMPSFSQLDSLTRWLSEKALDTLIDNTAGDPEQNMLSLANSNAKDKMLKHLLILINQANIMFVATAQINYNKILDKYAPTEKRLSGLRRNESLKGVPAQFLEDTVVQWIIRDATFLIHDGTKKAYYPSSTIVTEKDDKDLKLLTISTLRNKVGATDNYIQVIVSQEEGVLPELTEFHWLKITNEFGFNKSLSNRDNWYLEFLPEEKLTRINVRDKLRNNKKLARAVNILSQLCQMYFLWHPQKYHNLSCEPEKIYKGIIENGYNWDELLETRGWWTFENDSHPVPFLSTLDIMRMANGLYHPYWMKPKNDKHKDLLISQGVTNHEK